MKKLLILAVAIALSSCGTGTLVYFGPDGVQILPPVDPIVISTK